MNRKVKIIQIYVCIYVYTKSICPTQSIPKLLLVLRFNTRSVLLLLSVFPSRVSASERREILVEQLPDLLSQVPRLPSEALLCHTALRAGCRVHTFCSSSCPSRVL